jgi:hypothetical protein
MASKKFKYTRQTKSKLEIVSIYLYALRQASLSPVLLLTVPHTLVTGK